jgi:hypothetical protein
VCLRPGHASHVSHLYRDDVERRGRGRTNTKPVARSMGTHAMWIATFVGSRWYAPYYGVVSVRIPCHQVVAVRTKTRFFLRSKRGMVSFWHRM